MSEQSAGPRSRGIARTRSAHALDPASNLLIADLEIVREGRSRTLGSLERILPESTLPLTWEITFPHIDPYPQVIPLLVITR